MIGTNSNPLHIGSVYYMANLVGNRLGVKKDIAAFKLFFAARFGVYVVVLLFCRYRSIL